MKQSLMAILFLVGLVFPCRAQVEGFKTYRSSDGLFEIAGPGDPVKSARTVQRQGQAFEFSNYEFFRNDDRFTVSVSPVSPDVLEVFRNGTPEEKKFLASKFFEGIRSTISKSMEKVGVCTVKKAEEKFDGPTPFLFMECEFERKDGSKLNFFGKFLVTETHSFSLTVLSKIPRDTLAPQATGFFDSFRLLPAPPGKPQ